MKNLIPIRLIMSICQMSMISASIINLEKTHVFACLYMDDLLNFGSNLHVNKETKNMLSSHFDMKDLGKVNFILGMKIIKTCMVFSLISCIILRKSWKKYNHINWKHVSTSFNSSVHLFLVKNENDVINQKKKKNARLIGSLHYVTNYTRPNIAYVVGVLSRFPSKLGKNIGLPLKKEWNI